MRCSISINRDDTGWTFLRLQRLTEEAFCSRYIAMRTQPEVHGLALPIHGPVQISPDATDPDIGFVNTPGLTRLAGKAVPAALKLRNKTLCPAHDRRMGNGQAVKAPIISDVKICTRAL